MDILPEGPQSRVARQPVRARDFFSARPRTSLTPDPEAPDYLGRRFLGLCYRITRAILAQKGVVGLGQSINEVDQVRSPGLSRPLNSRAQLLGDSPFAGNDLAVCPITDPATQSQLAIYTSLQIDFDPTDPVLHWLEPDQLMEFWPTDQQLLRFEAQFLAVTGTVLLKEGRTRAAAKVTRILGNPSSMERRDLLSLPYAYVREQATATTEDERQVMASRLESLASRAVGALDLRVELAALRALATVQGLHAVDGDRSQRELVLLLGQPKTALQLPH